MASRTSIPKDVIVLIYPDTDTRGAPRPFLKHLANIIKNMSIYNVHYSSTNCTLKITLEPPTEEDIQPWREAITNLYADIQQLGQSAGLVLKAEFNFHNIPTERR